MDSDTRDESLYGASSGRAISRQALLEEAARTFDALPGHLGSTSPGAPPLATPQGTLTREMIEQDKLEFNGFPLIEKITEEEFEANKAPVPYRFKQLSKDYNFYKVRFPIYLHSAPHWAFDRFTLELELSSQNAPPHLQPSSYQILPAKQFVDLLKASAGVTISSDENFPLSAGTGPFGGAVGGATVSGQATVGGTVASNVGLTVGPLQFGLKKVKLDHSQMGTQKVWWKLNGSEFFEKESLDLLLIMQTPRETKDISINAWMSAARYFNFADAGLRQAVKQLREALRVFFEDGCPIDAAATWDLTPLLKKFK